jgi:hypothetical protein
MTVMDLNHWRSNPLGFIETAPARGADLSLSPGALRRRSLQLRAQLRSERAHLRR